MVNLSLGCVQFGMDYGYTNLKGKINYTEAGEIIDLAFKNNINNFDTAQSYGDSEQVLGSFLPKYLEAKIMTKFENTKNDFHEKKDINIWENNFQRSLKNLKTKKIHSFLIHNSDDLKKKGKEILEDWLESLVGRNLVKRLGISIYSASDLENICLEKFNLVQMPISLYDQRLIKDKTCQYLYSRNIAIHARSIFFQGLIFSNYKNWPSTISDNFKHHHRHFLSSLDKNSILELTMNFISNNKFIESALIGVTCLEELKEIINIKNKMKFVNEDFSNFAWKNTCDLDPRLW